jgi:hypothetical protein
MFCFWSSGFGAGLAPHGLAGQFDAKGIVDEAIEDGIGVGGIADHLMPSCLGIIGLQKRFGAERLEAAALRALEIQARNYPSIKSILEKGLDKVPVSKSPERAPGDHANIRGSKYYH